MFHKYMLAIAACAIAAPALAGPLEVSSTVMVEARARAADGTTRINLVKAERVVPGDRVVFVLSYRNTGRQALSDIVIANPVPAGLVYRAPAQGSPAPEVSTDGKTFGALATLRVPGPGGPRPATVEDVVQIRWRLARPLEAGAQGTFAFQLALK